MFKVAKVTTVDDDERNDANDEDENAKLKDKDIFI